MKTNKEFIEGIYEKVDEITKEKTEKKQRKMNKIINMVAIIVIIIAIGFNINIHQKEQNNEETLKNIKTEENNKISNNAKTEENIGLETVKDFSNFCSIIKNSKVAKENSYDEMTMKDLMNSTNLAYGNSTDSVNSNSTNSTESASTSERAESKTNNQVENVDEADIVKVHENYIYYISQKKVVIIDAQKGEEATKIAEIDYEEEFSPREMYVNKNKLIVIGGVEENYSSTKEKAEYVCIDRIAIDTKTQLIMYDITEKTAPKEIRKVEIDGNYISSRMVDNNIYFATNKSIYSSNILNKNEEELDEQEYKPKYKDTAISQETKCIEYDRIYCFNQIETTNYLMIVGINVEDNEEVDIQTFLGGGQEVYSSEKNMYIAKRNIEYDDKYNVINGSTHILKFALDNGKIKFKAEADVSGQINNQFSMDESGEYFRIATTTGDIWDINENTTNNLYILNSELKEVGKVTGFGKEEKIYSVRFTGDKAYVVTFKQTDPLFVIDLSEPTNPQILGELKIPGYSTYLHQYDETHLIGFGYDTKENGTQITTNGLKMAMFDITDLNNPKELFKATVGDKYTSSELIYNHKALLYSKEENIIAFPLTTYSGRKGVSKAAIYEIDLEKGFTLKGEIINTTDDYDYTKRVERIVYVNNSYYILSNSIIKVANMENLQIIKEIEI